MRTLTLRKLGYLLTETQPEDPRERQLEELRARLAESEAKLQEAQGELAALRVPESVPPEHK
jgi:hypothetical protein